MGMEKDYSKTEIRYKNSKKIIDLMLK